MAVEFNKIGDGIRQAAQPTIIAPGIGIRLLKTAAFGKAQETLLLTEHGVADLEELQEDFETTSYLGTPILDPFTFIGGNFFALDDINKENPIPFPDDRGVNGLGLIIPNMIIEVNQTKNIITTPIQGRDGTVKEFISRGDYVITLSGIITGKMDEEIGTVRDIGNVYPQDDVNKLITICEVPDSLSVTSDFLTPFLKNEPRAGGGNGIIPDTRVVITDYSIPQQIGVRDHQIFTINMLSDNPISLNELTPPTVINITTRVPAEPIIITGNILPTVTVT